MNESYHLENIRALLTHGITAEKLRRFCCDTPHFRPVYNQLAHDSGKEIIIDRLIEYADRKLKVDPLLARAKLHNPSRYEKHQPYFADISSFFSAPAKETLSKFHRTKKQRLDRYRRPRGAVISFMV